MRGLVRLRNGLERRRRARQWPEALVHVSQRLVGEASADMPGVDQLRPFIVADNQRAERDARLARVGPPADDELLLLLELELEPVARPVAGIVARTGLLRDHTLPVVRARAGQHAPAIRAGLGEPDGAVRRTLEPPLQRLPAFRPR